MKFRVCVIVSLLLLAVLFSAGCINDEETYKVGYNEANNILLTMDMETGEPAGPGVDLMNWIAEDLGIKFEYVPVKDNVLAVNDNIIDVSPWIYANEEAKNKLLLSDFYLSVNYGFVAKKSSDITVEEALSGNKIIATEIDSLNEKWLKSYFGEDKFIQMESDGKIIRKFTVDAAINEVEESKADVCFSNTALFSNRLTERKTLKYIGSVDETRLFTVGVKKENTKLIEKLNKGFEDFKASNFSVDFAKKYGYFYHKDTYTAGITDDYAPFSYLDENKEPTGFDVESLKWIADKYGFNVTFKYMSWSQGIYSLENHEIDMFYSSLTITNERSIKVTFSSPYFTCDNSIAKKKGSAVTLSMFENGEASIGAVEETTPYKLIIEYYGEEKSKKMIADGKIVAFENNDLCLNALLDGKIDLFITNTPAMKIIAEDYQVEIIKTESTDEHYGVAVQNGDTILLEMINNGLADLKSSGTYDSLLKKYNLD